MKANGAIGGVSVTLDPSTKEYNVNIAIPKESNPSVNVWSDFADVTLPLLTASLPKSVSIAFPERKIGIRCPMLNRPMESLLQP